MKRYPEKTEFEGVRVASATTYEIDFRYQGIRCRERIKAGVISAENTKRVSRHRESILDAISNNTFDYSTTFPESKNRMRVGPPGMRLTFASYVEDVYLPRAEQRLKSSTYAGYNKSLHFSCQYLGDFPLGEINVRIVKNWLESHLRCGPKRKKNLVSMVRCVLDEAVEDDLISMNPLKGWSPKLPNDTTKRKEKIDPFNEIEQLAILDQLDGPAKNQVQFSFWTGLRTSELVALGWEHIDFERQVVIVEQAETREAIMNGKGPEVPKTHAGKRVVKLLKPALEALRDQMKYTLHHPSGRVFIDPDTDEAWKGDAPIRKKLWIPALRRAGVRYRYPYQTRHTFASMMLSSGENMAWVSKTLGHSDLSQLAQRYGRWIPGDGNNSGAAAEEKFGKSMM